MKNRFTSMITKTFVMTMLCAALTYSPSFAQEEDDKFSMTVTLNSDQFFGFYPFFSGSYNLNEKVDLTFYGILWSG
nr:DUF6733 family protein [Belliella baltica]